MARFDRLAAVLLVVLAALFSLYAADHAPNETLARSDFAAFYCAGAVTLTGGNSDLAAPLEACERSVATSLTPSVTVSPGSVDPAPLPGYLIAPLTLVARLPFPVAVWLWEVALLAAIVATMFVLRELTKLPYLVIAAALIGTDVVACFTFGQLAPFATLALTIAARAVVRNDPRTAAVAAIATLIQPQIGLPIVLALFLWMPRARVSLTIGVVLLATLSFVSLGAARNLVYVQSVLPAQSAAEIPFRIQYSLSWLLWALGVPEEYAGRAGTADYVLWLVLGVAFARRVALRLESPPALLAFPAAAVLGGGAYLHQFQLCGAVPFALVLAASPAPRSSGLRAFGWTALAMLAVPWQDLEAGIGLALGALALAIVLAAALRDRPLLVRGAAAALAILLLAAFLPALVRLPATGSRPAPRAEGFLARGFDPALSSVQHGLRLREQPGSTDSGPQILLRKVPLWLGVWGLIGAGLVAGLGRVSPEVKISQALAG